MGDLLDEILSEMEDESKQREKDRSRVRNAERHRRLVAGKIRLATAVGELLKKNPRDAHGRCVFCDSPIPKRHRKGCRWLELYIEYATYKNKFLSGKTKNEP